MSWCFTSHKRLYVIYVLQTGQWGRLEYLLNICKKKPFILDILTKGQLIISLTDNYTHGFSSSFWMTGDLAYAQFVLGIHVMNV